ncbi:hypothetical protein AB3X96_30490 [Paraburkholderia sp. BR13439]|uniref:hypothetical protein n=1 Tax=Paraburkholderia sp. BR13439 TaxID=3236996 RepID=UPI0034CE7C1C
MHTFRSRPNGTQNGELSIRKTQIAGAPSATLDIAPALAADKLAGAALNVFEHHLTVADWKRLHTAFIQACLTGDGPNKADRNDLGGARPATAANWSL